MKKWMFVFALLAAGLGQAALMTDDFNRADTDGVKGAETLNTIGNNWVGTGDREWRISSFQLAAGIGTGRTYLYNTTQETLNEATETSFTQTVYATVNNVHQSVFAGMVVNYDINTGEGVLLRFSGQGLVQMLNSANTVLNTGTFSQTIDVNRAYRLTISSDLANTYDIEIYDPIADAVMYSASDVVNATANTSTDGFGGVFANTANVTFDNFSQNVVIPEPATLSLFSIAAVGLFARRYFRKECG